MTIERTDHFDSSMIDAWDKRGDTHPAVAVAKRLRASNLRLEGLCLAAKSALHTLQIALNVANEERDGWRERALKAERERDGAQRSAWEHAGMTLMLCESLGVSPDSVRATAVSRAKARWGTTGSTEDDSSDGR